MPCVNVPVLVAVEQLNAVIVPTGKATVLVKVQFCPPMLSAKLAVPLVAGVPVILNVNEPVPLAKLPAAKVAVLNAAADIAARADKAKSVMV